MGTKFEIALEALGVDGTDVPLEAFHKSLENISKFLRAIDEDISGKPEVQWVVEDLHHSHPTVVLEGHSEVSSVTPEAVLARGLESIEKLGRGEDDPLLSDQSLKALRSIIAPFGKSLRAVHLKADDTAKTLDLDFAATFGAIKFETQIYEEEWQGSLDEINFHRATPACRLYPLLVPRFITCEFDLSLKEKMTEALERKVSIYGAASYRPNAKYPSAITVKELSILDEVPDDLAEMHFPDAGKEKYKEQMNELIGLRDGWS
jgi:hypothetical protein